MEVAGLLEETLNEEKEADEKLTEISEQLLSGIDAEAEEQESVTMDRKRATQKSKS
jgi:ferritin-like metal-binding protein YciE